MEEEIKEETGLKKYSAQVDSMERKITDITVDAVSKGNVVDFISALSKARKNVDDERKQALQPLRLQIDEVAKPYIDLVAKIDIVIELAKNKINAFVREENRQKALAQAEQMKQLEEKRKADFRAAVQSGDTDRALQVSSQPIHIEERKPEKIEGNSARTFVTREVNITIVDFDKIPDRYLIKSIDSAKVKKDVLSGLVESIPGLKIEVTEGVGIRAKVGR